MRLLRLEGMSQLLVSLLQKDLVLGLDLDATALGAFGFQLRAKSLHLLVKLLNLGRLLGVLSLELLVLRQHLFDLDLLLIGDSQEFFEDFGILALEVGDTPLSGLVALPQIHKLLCVLFVLKRFVDLVAYLGLAAGL